MAVLVRLSLLGPVAPFRQMFRSVMLPVCVFLTLQKWLFITMVLVVR